MPPGYAPWVCATGGSASTEGAVWSRPSQRKVPAEQHGGVGAQALRDVSVPSMRLAVLVRLEESREIGGGHGARGRCQRARRVRKATQAAASRAGPGQMTFEQMANKGKSNKGGGKKGGGGGGKGGGKKY